MLAVVIKSRWALLWFVLFTSQGAFAQQLPRTDTGRPNLQGIWQVHNRAASDLEDHAARKGMPAGKGVVEGGSIPYQPWAAAKRLENFTNRETADPLRECYFPGVPRIMYLSFPFHIFQTSEHVAIAFEWSHVHRLIYTTGKPPLHGGIESWMGDSRGRWEGDTLVVEVTDHNDKTWFDMAGNFHSDALRLTERYTMLDANTIQYEVTIQDPKVFTRPCKISMPIFRQMDMNRILEYQCQAEAEEANGAFERDHRTWYPPSEPPSTTQNAAMVAPVKDTLPSLKAGTNLRRIADGRPDLSGYYQPDHGDGNFALERHARIGHFQQPPTRGIVVDPADGVLPYQPWAREEQVNRELPHRGYDDPLAHCFTAGVPRSMFYPFQILQPPGYVVLLFERMSWRLIPLDGRTHLPDNIRLWQGDSIGRWEGDTLIVETTNLNGKAWLNEMDVVSHAQRIVERFIPVETGKIVYRATVTDPIVYTRPWTIEFQLNRVSEELLEVACHEDNADLQHLKDVRDQHRAEQKK
jgi:hypothetical protein